MCARTNYPLNPYTLYKIIRRSLVILFFLLSVSAWGSEPQQLEDAITTKAEAIEVLQQVLSIIETSETELNNLNQSAEMLLQQQNKQARQVNNLKSQVNNLRQAIKILEDSEQKSKTEIVRLSKVSDKLKMDLDQSLNTYNNLKNEKMLSNILLGAAGIGIGILGYFLGGKDRKK